MPSSIWDLFCPIAFGTSVVSDSEAGQDLEIPKYHGAFIYVISLVSFLHLITIVIPATTKHTHTHRNQASIILGVKPIMI